MLSLGLHMGVGSPRVRSGFALTDISGLQAWYKFNTGITTSGTTVLTWDDSSGNNRRMGNITATNRRPEFDSSDNTVDFSTNRYLELNSTYGTDSDFPNSNEFTAFMAIRIPYDTSVTKISTIVSGGNNDSATVGNLAFLPGDNSYYSFNGHGNDQNYALARSSEQTHVHVNNQLFVYAIRRTGTTMTFMRNSRSNVIISQSKTNTTATFDIDTLGTTAVGGTSVTIAEIAMYNSSLSDSDFDTVIDDIKTRVGI